MTDAEITMYPVEIAKAIIAVKKQVKQLGVSDRNEHGKYSYVSVDKFYERIGKLMADAGLALLIDETASDVKDGKSGNPWLFAQYALRFMQESGAVSEPLRRSLAMPINGPQTYGAAQSYIEKQFLRQVFKVPTGEKDADDTAQDDAPAPRQAPRAGMVRAADVPPRQHDEQRASNAAQANQPNGNGDAKLSIEERAAIFRKEMMGWLAKCKLPEDARTIIKNNSKALDGLKKMAPDVYDEIMAESNRITNEMYGATG